MSPTRTVESEQHGRGGRRHGDFAPTSSIARAIVIKDADLFFLSEPDGSVPRGGRHGFGLYYHDCRFCNAYDLRLAGEPPKPLVATAAAGFSSVTELTNPTLQTAHGALEEEDVGIKWERTLDAAKLALRDRLTVRNFGVTPVHLPLTLRWGAAFEDIFAVRGLAPGQRGTIHVPRWHDGVLLFQYDGADGVIRCLAVHLSPPPARTDGTSARFDVDLAPDATMEILASLVIAESRDHAPRPRTAEDKPDVDAVHHVLTQSTDHWLARHPEVRSSSRLLDDVMDRSLRDLHVLRSELRGRPFFAAGVPWYVTLFGRDSILATLETLAWEPDIAEQTLRLLAGYQGTRVDEHREEQPGKILHELRVGEMAHLGEIPQTPYYGSIDATPLFLVLLCRHAAWTGELRVFDELREHVDRALRWMTEHGDANHDGYLEYTGSSAKGGLVNQGWKDSGDAISNADGSLARPPISLVEVQGYAYLARTGLADLYARAGDRARAEALRRDAEALRARFNRDFWMEEPGCYALALQQGGAPATVVASNAGQALWTGIADADKARRTAERLMADDMFTGWGIRTLSSRERRYNPIGYHVGTVWPHDNALIAAGFRRYGLDEHALTLFAAVTEAATHFEHDRLPEVFAGFPRAAYHVPVRYPVACHPQAWAAGAVPYLLETCLGLEPDAFDHRLRVVRPLLPKFVRALDLARLRVGQASVDLHFERTEGGHVAAKVTRVEGHLDVNIETS